MGLTNAYRDLVVAATNGESITPFTNATAYLGVGDGTTPFSAGQTDLQGANTFRKAMDATYPQRAGNVLTYRATFGSGEANFAWQECGVFNAASGGTMLLREVTSQGTKVAGSTWVFTLTATVTV